MGRGFLYLGKYRMNIIDRHRAIVAAMIPLLIAKGYTNAIRLHEMVHDLFPRHRLHDSEIRAIIHRAKCR